MLREDCIPNLSNKQFNNVYCIIYNGMFALYYMDYMYMFCDGRRKDGTRKVVGVW